MKKEDIIRKLTSRKLWTAVASFVALLIVATGHTESEAAQIPDTGCNVKNLLG